MIDQIKAQVAHEVAMEAAWGMLPPSIKVGHPQWVRFSPWIPHAPTSRQKLFLDLNCKEAFYGGAAGGGKSDALLMDALHFIEIPKYAAILFRRTYADLALPEALMSRAQEWLKTVNVNGRKAHWRDKDKTWVFPSSATLTFGYLDTENDKYRYQGSAYQYIGFDELTQFTETQYAYLFSRLRRLANVNIPLKMRSASNPGGIGARWVHERFIPEQFTPAQSREPITFEKRGIDDEGTHTSRVFVPARLEDNPHLDQATYESSLRELDPVTRAQLLKGDWEITTRGDILDMWSEPYHVISWSEFASIFDTKYIPLHWLLGVYQDWGSTAEHPCVTTWLATAPKNSPTINGVRMAGAVFIYRGLTRWNATVRDVAIEINDLMRTHGEKARVRRWQMSHEASSERMAYQREHGLPFSSWTTGKTRGLAQLRNALQLTETDKPHPFRPLLTGHPQLYFIVDDAELVYAKTDAGLARHRAEAPAYRWNSLKSGDPVLQLAPYALFNDAMDTVRAAAADYWPDALALTEKEKMELAEPRLAKLNEQLRETKTLSASDQMSYYVLQSQAKKLVGRSGIKRWNEDGSLIRD